MVLHMKLRKLYHLVCFLSLFQAVICLSQVSDSISHYLMNKYSNSSGYLTKDDLQKLLDKLKTCCSMNSTLMDPSADSAPCNQSQYCSLFQESFFSAENVFTHLKIEDGKFSATSLEQMCPLVLGQLENSACSLNSEFGSKDSREEKRKPTQSEVWGYGFLFVTLISLCSLLGVSVLPFMGKEFYKQLLTALIGLAVGSLAASSVFHLIPQAFGLVDLDSHHNYLSISIMMWSGIWVFFMTERIMKIITDARQKKIASKDKVNNPLPAISSQTNISHQSQKTYDSEPLQHAHDSCMISDPGAIYDYQEQAIKASFGHQEKPHVSHEHVMHFEQGKDSAIATVAWMVIFGDGLHNFIDGLSIGAAFNESILTGISISVAVMCEEFPHELGDFAVLLNAGMSLKQALLYNFLSACTCYLGLILGILLGEIEASIYIFGFAAGMFLYISLVDMQAVDSPKQPAVAPVRMVPEMNEVAEEASKISVKKAFQTLLLQNLGMAIGVSALYILALYQDSINFN